MISARLSAADMSSESPQTDHKAGLNTDVMEWKIFLMAERPVQAIGVAIAFALILTWSVIAFHNVLVGLAGCIAAAGAIKEYLFPLKFRLTSDSASVTCAGVPWVELPWSQVRSVYQTPSGLKLSPYANPKLARTENLRGMTLRARADQASEVANFVARMTEIGREVQQ
jgi:hypothetical protein